MVRSQALQLNVEDIAWKIVQGIVVKIIVDKLYSYGKVLWKQYQPSLIELKGKAIFSLHYLALITGIESLGVFILVCYSRRKKEYGMLVTLFIVLIAVLADKSRDKPKARFGSFLPIIKLA